MFNISSFLEKFKSIGLSETLLKENLIETIGSMAGVVVTRKDITLKNGTAFIQTTAVAKNRIFIKKSAILAKIQAGNGEDKLVDIR